MKIWCASSWLAFLIAAVAAMGVDFSALPSLGYVSDYAKVVDAGSKAVLKKYCAGVEEAAGVRMELATVRTLGGEPVEDVAKLLARRWGLADGGILLLLVVDEKSSLLEVGAGLEEAVPSGYISTLLSEMRPALRRGDHGEALLVAAQVLGRRLAEARGVVIEPAPERRRNGSAEPVRIPWLPVATGLALIAWLAWVSLHRQRRRAGGGFGEYDSYDRTGGFGG